MPLPFIAWLIHPVRDRLRTGFEKIDRVWGEVTNVLADTIPGIRVVKAFAQEKREAHRFRDANQHNLQVERQARTRPGPVHAHRVAADRNRACWWCGPSASGWCRGKSDHGGRAHRLHHLHRRASMAGSIP